MAREPGPNRVFLLSPANCGGVRARIVASENAEFPLARQLRAEGAALGDIFAFVSGLYFRGKLAYARRFARPPEPTDPVIAGGVLVITPNAGLRAADTLVTTDSFRAFAEARIDLRNAAYRQPLERGARALFEAIGPDCEVVLLGSIASGKYVEVLEPIFGDRLLFPPEFVGRGDMSRGGLMLRCVTAGLELDYAPIQGAVRHGQRPPKLAPLSRQPPSSIAGRTTKATTITEATKVTKKTGATKATKAASGKTNAPRATRRPDLGAARNSHPGKFRKPRRLDVK